MSYCSHGQLNVYLHVHEGQSTLHVTVVAKQLQTSTFLYLALLQLYTVVMIVRYMEEQQD